MRDALGREDGKGESVFTPEEVQALRDYAKNPEAFNAALREAALTTPQPGKDE
jgi:UDP-N-acetylmuramyl tripeptide synthase